MTSPPSTAAVTSLATVVGRYFTVVSLVPGLLLVSLVYVLARSGAWTGLPDFGTALATLSDISLGGALGLLTIALVVGAVLHPVQLAVLQFLEGYWGFGPLGSAAPRHGVGRQLRRRQLLFDEKNDTSTDETAELRRNTAEMWLEIYPNQKRHVMPTRLGNALRAAETRAGRAVGLDIRFTPHLMQVAPPQQAEYVNDQRTTLDLVVRIWLTCVLATAVTAMFLWSHGWYLLLALVPYGFAVLSYRGAVTAAQEYGAALGVLFDLNRFALYRSLHLPLPASTAAERQLVQKMRMLTVTPSSDPANDVAYRHPPEP